MSNFEKDYLKLVQKVLDNGTIKKVRNWWTIALFWEILEIDSLEYGLFPILTSRKIYYNSALWEFAAIIRWPKHISDFTAWGCNYRDKRARADGSIKLDYWNKRLNFHWYNQLDKLITNIKSDPWNRKLLINARDPSNLENLDLECCHYAYQFFVRNWKLDMLWNQRSADLMVGIPYDIILAAIFLLTLSSEVNLRPWTIKMVLWDVHIYDEHIDKAKELLKRDNLFLSPSYKLKWWLYWFEPANLTIKNYKSGDRLDFILKE